MNGTCRVEFFKGDAWPFHIDVTVDKTTIHFNISESHGWALEAFLRDRHATAFETKTEQGGTTNDVAFTRINSIASIKIRYRKGGCHIYIDNDLVENLADGIYNTRYKQPYIVQKQEQVDATPQPVVDPLAKAKKRTDDNLRRFFGFA